MTKSRPPREPANSSCQDDLADPPGLSWLIARLAQLNNAPEIVRPHALKILGTVGFIRARGDRYGYLFEPGKKERHKTVLPSRGPARELEELRRAARRAIKQNNVEGWLTAWAAVPHRTRGLVWVPPVPPVIDCRRDESGRLIAFRRTSYNDSLKGCTIWGPGFTMIVPPPTEALPLIEVAICRLRATPAKVRRKRTSDLLAANLGHTIKTAYAELTGKLPKPVLRKNSRLDSGLISLARDIDARFRLCIFSADDSPRLRALSKN